ncbi:MAG: MBL fold metallo-hydrolase [Chloroflexota bacterium]|nr:MBL fold metallo-hydrolase [Chloroflexota bacterium]
MRPVDRASVTVLVDNSVDVFLPNSDIARRPDRPWDPAPGILRAEHGLSLLLRIAVDGRESSVLYDAALGRDTAVHNMDVLGAEPHDLRAIVLSHGHVDHYSGLEGVARRIGRAQLPLLLHPDARRDRKIVFPSGEELLTPPPSMNDLEREGVTVVEERGPTLLIDDAVLVTGEVERRTDFERGFPLQYWRSPSGWEPDFAVEDDQAVIVNVRGHGLVVLSGCSHAGIVNILRFAQRVTGVDRILAVIGGFHLTGPLFEPLISRTIEELVAIAPQIIVPGHCTGWKAIHAIARQLPAAYVQTSVGTTFEFEGSHPVG